MKKVLLSAVAIFAFGFANAQEVKFGAKAGLNISTITGGYLSGTSKTGFHVGGLAEIKLNDKFAIQPELLYSTKGASYNFFGFGFGVNEKEDITLSYIDLPIMAKYFVIERLSIEAGPQIGFLMAAKGPKYNEVNDTTDPKGDVKDAYNSTDFGFNIGAGYELKQGIMFQARYSLGLSDISKSIADEINYKDKNAAFQVSVGYKF
jgi:hypothetical protein